MSIRMIVGSIIVLLTAAAAQAAPLTTAFTYQGQLKDGGNPANGVHDLRFRLYDALSGGAQVGTTQCINNVNVSDGLFTVPLDFGAQFAGQQRFLEIDVRTDTGLDCANASGFTVLTPRQALTAAPNALFAQSVAVPLTLSGTSNTHIIRADNASTGFIPIAIYGLCSGASGGTTGVRGESASTNGRGVIGFATAASGTTYGGQFESTSTDGTGVWGKASATSGSAYGVFGESASTGGRGVFGFASAGSGTNYGVYGRSDSPTGRGVFGYANADTGVNYGVYGQCDSPDGFAGIFIGEKSYFQGNVGIRYANPERALDVRGRIRLRQDTPASTGNSAGIDFYQQTPAEDRAFIGMRDDNQIGLYGRAGSGWSFVMDVANGNIGIGTTSPQAKLHVNGTARCDVLEIVGADLAEKFPVSEEVKPGMVVMIDAANPGKLCLARGAYNRGVAGVASGANGLSAGTVLGNLPGNEKSPPIALSGRVWVYCDAGEKAVEVTDLLTTSETPGHAMTALDAGRSHGAVIGKAMTGLAKGDRGLVLVLVNLQ